MCFFIHDDHPTVKIARRDIVCYKILGKRGKYLISPWRLTKYYIGAVKRSKIEIPDKPFKSIHVGLHSYSTVARANCEIGKVSCLGKAIYRAIIPEGAEYFYNSGHNEYCSSKLQIITKIE